MVYGSLYFSLDFESNMTEINSPNWSDSVSDLSYDVQLSVFINNLLVGSIVFSLLSQTWPTMFSDGPDIFLMRLNCLIFRIVLELLSQ